ncbi:MAG: OmpA family protein [Silicimonas sp.]|nr:OmpA family protein [Silicimonas sp.]
MSPRPSPLLTGIVPHVLAIFVAAAGCLGAAVWAKEQIERATLTDLNLVLSQSGHDWTNVAVDGLSVELTGVAPDEATRFAALSVAGTVVDASRVIDNMGVVAAAAIAAPDFAIEILKNQDEISLIGLVPLVSDPESIVEGVKSVASGAEVSDLLEVADFPVPEGWDIALAYGIDLLDTLPSSKLTVGPGALSIKAVAESPEDQQRLERQLKRNAPSGVRLTLDIRAPRPVVAPFILRAVLDENGGRFDACTADSEEARKIILEAAFKANISGGAACILGLGTPSTNWATAAVAGFDALQKIGGGTLTISNADVTLVGRPGTSATLFERTAGELEYALPPVFSLATVLPVPEQAPEDGAKAPPEFVATRSPEGQVQLRGRLSDETMRAAVISFAAAQFGSDNVAPAMRLDADVPPGWPKRVMAALSALGKLHNGVATVTPERIEVRGTTGDQNAQGEIAGLLSEALGGAAKYELDVTYREALDPLASIPTPEECIAMLNEAGAARKITFAPSSTDIEEDAQETIDKLAEILRDCQGAAIEIGGHTDSQGREVMNEQLSQARADAVLNAIMARRILVSNLTAKGYGESRPIADNDTEEGREANRRIEFRLVDDQEDTETAEVTDEEDPGAEAGDDTEESTE